MKKARYTEDQIITSDPSQILAIKKAKQDLATSQESDRMNAASATSSTTHAPYAPGEDTAPVAASSLNSSALKGE